MFVVAGVSGNTGSVVAETLLAQKQKVRVLVRDAAKGEAWKARGAEVHVADLGNEAALTAALRGANGAYLLSPPDMGSPALLEQFAARTTTIARAVEASGVGHVVFLSSVGAQHPTGTGPIRTVHDAEAKLSRTGAATTFVRAAYFMENWGSSLAGLEQGVFPTFLRADVAVPMVATRDIGRVAAHALVEKRTGILELEGPRAYTPREVAKALSSLVGKELAVQEGPEEAIVPAFTSFGVSANVAELFREMIHGVNTGHVTWEGGAAQHLRGTVPIEEVLAKLLGRG